MGSSPTAGDAHPLAKSHGRQACAEDFMIDRVVFGARTTQCVLAVSLAFLIAAPTLAAAPMHSGPVALDAAQVAALSMAPEFADTKRGVGSPRLHASLRRAETAFLAGQRDLTMATGLPPRLVDGEYVLVEIRHDVRGRGADALPGLRTLDARIRHPGHRGLTEAWVPATRFSQLAALPDVHHVGPARLVRGLAGSATSQGVAAGAVEAWHGAGLDGAGIAVAIIDSFDDSAGQIAALQASGDWPQEAQLDRVRLGGGDFGDSAAPHGNAVLEAAFDVAPGAHFIAYDVLTVGDWRSAIDLAVAAGADVIASALAAPLDGIGDGSALPASVAERVEAAASAGVLYLNAAGNARQRHWGGLYSPSTNPAVLSWSGPNERFNVMLDGAGQPACIADGEVLVGELFWDDWDAVNHDYDLALYERIDDGENELWFEIEVSDDVQDGGLGQRPQERIERVAASIDSVVCGPGAGRYSWQVRRVDAASDRNLQFFAYRDLAFSVAARSLVFPADSPAAVAVAALDVVDSTQLDSSSEGPILAPGGGLPTGTEDAKPDLASFAGVDTVTFGAGAFTGSSAALAHAAGMAALLKQRHADFDRDQLADRLRAIAATGSNDLGAAGHDFRHGAGRLRLQTETLLVVTGSPATAETNTFLSPVEVELRDDEDLPVLSGPVTDVTVAIGNDPSAGAATLSGTLTVPLTDGFAAFTDLSIDEPGFAYTLSFISDGDVPAAESAAFNVVLGGPGVPSQLHFSVQPSTAQAGIPLAPVVTVEVQDSEGAVVVTDNETAIELLLIDDPGASGLAGNGPVTVSNGVAQFPALSINRAGSGYRLHAQTDAFGVVGADSAFFDILPGPAARLTIAGLPLNVDVDAILPPLEVAVADRLGNAQTDDDSTEVTVLLFANPGGALLSGTLVRTVSAGVATFDDLSLDQDGTGYRLLFRADVGGVEEILAIDGFSLGGGQSVQRSVDAGVLNRALVRGLHFHGTVSGIGGGSTWASDLRMDVVGPSGSEFAVGGFNNPAPVLWDFNGSGSTHDGTYSSTHEGIFASLLGDFTADAGTWQFEFRHDWTNSPDTMTWNNVSVTLLKDDLYTVSLGFAVGGSAAQVTLDDLVQMYTGAPLEVSVITDPPGLAVEVTYDESTSAPVEPGLYAVYASVTEQGFYGVAEGVFEILPPVQVEVTLSDLVQTYSGTPLAVTVTTDPPDVNVEVAYDGDAALPVNAGVYAVVATVVEHGFAGSASDSFEIEQAGTVTVLDSDANPVDIGETLTLTAAVSGVDPGGTVSFFDGATPIAACSAVPLSGAGATREAQCVIADLSGGVHDLAAEYAGDGNHLPSDDDHLQTVNPYGTTLTLDASVTSSDRDEPASFAATLTVPHGAIFTPSGTLTVSATQGLVTEECQAVVAAAGSHGCDIVFADPAAGLYEVEARFQSADANFASSQDDGAVHSVLRVADLAITKFADPPAAGPGQPLEYLVEVDNLGPHEAVAVNVLDALPAQLLTPTWECEGESGAVCPDANGSGDLDETVDLPVGGRLLYLISGILDDPLPLPVVNQALVATTEAGFTRDPEPGNNSATAVFGEPEIFADGFESPAGPDPVD
ncbi:MAG TPA: MBG domain-containing protein [Xanthomonadaceae bacterium]|nr:MBG domain-containing protein [Xanthomonadaceae bacterium]